MAEMKRMLALAGLTVAICTAPTPPAMSQEALLPDQAPILFQRTQSDDSAPEVDAERATARGEFGLFVSGGGGRGGPALPVGILCRTPYQATPLVLFSRPWGDSWTEVLGEMRRRYENYAQVYNRVVVDHPLYPYADLCSSAPADYRWNFEGGPYGLIDRPARRLKRAPLSLYEAARRGSVSQIRAQLRSQDVNDQDVLGMTALAWAVAHDRRDAIDLLLRSGAASMPAVKRPAPTPVLAAIRFDRRAVLARLDPPSPLPSDYVDEAIRSGSEQMVRDVLARPHQPPSLNHLDLPPDSIVELLLQDQGKLAANVMLQKAVTTERLSTIRLSLAHGADVNAESLSGRAPLLIFLDYPSVMSESVLTILLQAGADPNKRARHGAGFDTPFWRSYFLATSSTPRPQIFHRLLTAGGDAGVDRRPGVPSAWDVIFRPSSRLTETSAPPPHTLALLVKAGMDLNTPYEGRCLLDLVDQTDGVESELSAVLQSLGAKRSTDGGLCAA
ncbi:MAG: hypothetical protein ACK4NU_10390 [Brevundimonas sp.]